MEKSSTKAYPEDPGDDQARRPQCSSQPLPDSQMAWSISTPCIVLARLQGCASDDSQLKSCHAKRECIRAPTCACCCCHSSCTSSARTSHVLAPESPCSSCGCLALCWLAASNANPSNRACPFLCRQVHMCSEHQHAAAVMRIQGWHRLKMVVLSHARSLLDQT